MQELILEERTVFRGRSLRVLERDIRVSESQTVTWEVLDKSNSVAIVAIDDKEVIWLVEEYFGGTNERSLCLPKGRIDKGEDPATAAARELREEIGMSGDLTHLVTMSVSPGYLTQRTEVFLATGLRQAPLAGDERHHLEIARFPFAQAIEMCAKGIITEARTIGAVMLASHRLSARREDS
jgi:8-oxo-dGTP pyrophosphatase MutT (NUDIX family)